MGSKQKKELFGIMALMLLFLTISCVPVKKLKYINDIDESKESIINPMGQRLIKPYDRVLVKVFSVDEKINQIFSSDNISISSAQGMIGYQIDEDGNIIFPFTGKVNFKGLNTEQAGIKLGKALSDYVSNVSVIVKFIDSFVTTIGEVQNQGTHSFVQDKLNIYEALALGGGITNFGDRKNVILIRKEGDRIVHYKLNLSDSRIAGKDYYYIHSSDVIVVEPLKSSPWYKFYNSTYSSILSTLSFLLAFYAVYITIPKH